MTAMHAQQSASARWVHVLMRIFAGAILCQHGAQKVFGAFGGMDGAGHTVNWGANLVSIAGPLELIGGVLIVVGLFTHVAAFILSGEMAAIYFLKHIEHSFWPIQNHGEIPVVLCFVFLYFAATGAGVFSLDHLRKRNTPSTVMS
ncbi:MAG: DoxX family protein [Gemmatimonadaceae bacterium]